MYTITIALHVIDNIKLTIVSEFRLKAYVEYEVEIVLVNIRSTNMSGNTSETSCILTERVCSVGNVSNLYSGVARIKPPGHRLS
jgi:hypothetical protein